MYLLQCMHIRLCIEYNAHNALNIMQCREDNWYNSMHWIEAMEFCAYITNMIKCIQCNAFNRMHLK